MKKYADFQLSKGSYKRISIWDIHSDYKKHREEYGYLYDLKQFYKDFYKGKIVSTHSNPEKKKPLSLCIMDNYKDSYFRYRGSNDLEHHCSKESAQHDMFKVIVSDYDKLVIMNNNQKITLYITDSDIEHELIANGNRYYADVYFRFYKSEPEEYLYKWNGKLCFEVNYTHPVDYKKRVDCLREGFPIFEHKISKVYAQKIEDINSKEMEQQVMSEIGESLKRVIYGKLISDPESIGYSKIRELQNELHNFKQQRNEEQKSMQTLERSNADIGQAYAKTIQINSELSDFRQKVQSKRFLSFLLKLYSIK